MVVDTRQLFPITTHTGTKHIHFPIYVQLGSMLIKHGNVKALTEMHFNWTVDQWTMQKKNRMCDTNKNEYMVQKETLA